MTRPRMLWVGDCTVATGFARLTHAVCDAAVTEGWDVAVLGISYRGDPHDRPYPIYPAMRRFTDDPFGVDRVGELADELKPDVVVVVNDPWNVPAYIEQVDHDIPVVAALCVDGKNCRGRGMNRLRAGIFATQFGLDEARAGGFTAGGYVVPYGVDNELFCPAEDKRRARLEAGFPPEMGNDFIVGTVARNHPRKRLDLTVRYFAKWLEESGAEDARLFVHATPANNQGYDIDQLGECYGLQGRQRLLVTRNFDSVQGMPESKLVAAMASLDVYLTTTQGEGWGLPVAEAMASGVPVIAPDWAALGEWAAPAALLVPCTSVAHTPNTINALGGVPDEAATIAAIDKLYRDHEHRRELAELGLELVAEPRFRWHSVADAFLSALADAVGIERGGARRVAAEGPRDSRRRAPLAPLGQEVASG